MIVDVDGTLCDVREIRGWVEPLPSAREFKADFDRFHSESINCPPHPAVVDFVSRAKTHGFAVLVVTAREQKWSFLTLLWLAENGVEFDELYMRANADYRPDAQVKAEIERAIAARFVARLALDDRSEIIEVWRAAGIATAQVTSHGTILPAQWPASGAADPRLAELFGGS
ncbi:phosphatase domain-containing protein [Cellulomonas sp. P5_E12]